MRYILLNPGPVSLSERVRRAAVGQDLCHREPEYFRVQDRVRQALLGVYGCEADAWTSVLLGGSGTTALEAMMSSLLPRDGRLLIIENGVYGERISRIADIHGIAFEALHHDWMAAIDPARVGEALQSGRFTHVAAVHHETTTGRLNDVRELAAQCEAHGAALLLDAVSSFGAESIPFDSPALTACAATANKCLHGIPGLCLVLSRRTALQEAVDPPRSLYLHLPLWAQQQDRQSTPFTPPVNAVLALEEALRELAGQGGWCARHAHYAKLAGRVKRALVRLGVEPLLAPGESSCVLNAYRLPAGISYAQVHDGLKQRGFVIYAGQGVLASEMFRISTMGDIGSYDMERLLAALQAVFSD
ncbi:MAG: 2-aminoethylphosphonate aminotransferase [Xanthomonadales bacterium]|nr:2-aminoethylphosphonate aminotransferase [Xanthomonadales bacterium]